MQTTWNKFDHQAVDVKNLVHHNNKEQDRSVYFSNTCSVKHPLLNTIKFLSLQKKNYSHIKFELYMRMSVSWFTRPYTVGLIQKKA